MHNRKQQISNLIDIRPDPEVVATAKRRSFSKAEKLRILAAADPCTAPGDIGTLLRRDGIYLSHLATWREQRQIGGQAQLVEGKRGPEVNPTAAQDCIVLQLQSEVALAQQAGQGRLDHRRPKKLSILLGLSTSDTTGTPK
jgi:transposase